MTPLRACWCIAFDCAALSAMLRGTWRHGWRRWWDFWTVYLFLGATGAPFYRPEDPAWASAWEFWLIGMVVLRVLAALEALHFATCRLRGWSRIVLGTWLVAAALTALAWHVTASGGVPLFVELRRMLQIWIAGVALATILLLTVFVGIRAVGWHAGILGLMVCIHGAVSVASIKGPWERLGIRLKQ